MSTPKVSVILCEGYHDRAFWAGLLEHQGWIDPGKPEDEESERKPVKDPWKRPVTRGKFLFEWHDEGGKAYVIVDPTRGESHMRKRLFDYFEDTDHPVQRILVNLDGDVFARRAGDWRENLERCVEGMVKAAGGVSGARRGADGWTASVHGCPITVVPIACHAGDDPSPGGPVEPNLESLVCTAITTVHPSRGREIADWLASRKQPRPDPIANSYSWSHMAGWYPDRGCEDFFRNAIWEDGQVRDELLRRLEQIGALLMIELLR